jgi:hypothetical protein
VTYAGWLFLNRGSTAARPVSWKRCQNDGARKGSEKLTRTRRSHRSDSNIRFIGRSFYEKPADLDRGRGYEPHLILMPPNTRMEPTRKAAPSLLA